MSGCQPYLYRTFYTVKTCNYNISPKRRSCKVQQLIYYVPKWLTKQNKSTY